jgi:hypothetical protein
MTIITMILTDLIAVCTLIIIMILFITAFHHFTGVWTYIGDGPGVLGLAGIILIILTGTITIGTSLIIMGIILLIIIGMVTTMVILTGTTTGMSHIHLAGYADRWVDIVIHQMLDVQMRIVTDLLSQGRPM